MLGMLVDIPFTDTFYSLRYVKKPSFVGSGHLYLFAWWTLAFVWEHVLFVGLGNNVEDNGTVEGVFCSVDCRRFITIVD